MTEAQLAILKQVLGSEFVFHLPSLLDQTAPVEQSTTKNIARAFSAFALEKIAKLDAVTTSKAVTDDFDDNGLDAIHYHQPSKKLFLVQGKLRADVPFSQNEANAFCNGTRDLLYQRYDRFNRNVEDRQGELDAALDDAVEIVLIVAHVGPVISQHAADVMSRFLNDPEKPDERLRNTYIDFGPEQIVENLLAVQAPSPVDTILVIYGQIKIDGPRLTYYGQVSVSDLAGLYALHGNALLEKNIRYFLGADSSDVNRAICTTLGESPSDFFYLSNGITAIAHSIEPRGLRGGGRQFEVRGLSVINGAQTIASCQQFIATRPQVDVSASRVLLTLIQVDQADPFGSRVTWARNHQNPVALANFAALDDLQERLRRELAFDSIIYRYRPELRQATPGVDAITIDDAAYALALFHPDPGMPVILKREPSKLLDTTGSEYSRLFNPQLSGRMVANAVRLYHRASRILGAGELSASGLEKLIYRHGRYAILWLALNTNQGWLNRDGIMTADEAGQLLSLPLDAWRERVRAQATADLVAADKGPLAFFRNLTNARPFAVRLRNAGI
jgi:hypothetical protein